MAAESLWVKSYWRVVALAALLALVVGVFSPWPGDLRFALLFAGGSLILALLSLRFSGFELLHPFFTVVLSLAYVRAGDTLAAQAAYWVFVFLGFLALYAGATLRGLPLGLGLLIVAFAGLLQLPMQPADTLGALFFWGVALGMGLEYYRVKRELMAHQQELATAAFTDALTGLGNRHALETDYPRFQALAARSGQKLWLTFWDVDGLKAINDRKGHAIGDLFLKRFAQVLRQSVRASDGVYRYGGDEFVGLHLGLEDPRVIEERVRGRVRKFSMGFAEANGLSLEEALRRADERLYARKGTKDTKERQQFLTQELFLLDGTGDVG